MKKDCLMQYKDITRIEVIDKNGRIYSTSMGTMPVISFQDDGKTLKVFTNSSPLIDVENRFDPMNVLIVGGIPYTFDNITDIISEEFDSCEQYEFYESYEERATSTFLEIIDKLQSKTKDLSLDAWIRVVTNGDTTLGYDDWVKQQ